MPALAEPEPMARAKPNRDPVHEKLRRLIDAKCPDRPMADIAASAGMRKQALHFLMSGGVEHPRLDTLYALLDAIGATLSEFERA